MPASRRVAKQRRPEQFRHYSTQQNLGDYRDTDSINVNERRTVKGSARGGGKKKRGETTETSQTNMGDFYCAVSTVITSTL